MPSKRHTASGRASKGLPNTRSRTRTCKSTLFDPEQNGPLLNNQLRALGLYAADIIGDGNCLFRALSDQLWGTQTYHLKLREEVCDWIASRKDRYAPFVDDERGLDVHLRCMRTPGTYGGHLELSAFAHCRRRDLKVIQPGLVYVIEWNTGVNDDAVAGPSSQADDAEDRERRRLRRTSQKHAASKPATASADEPPEEATGTIYVAYHDWEHFSSVRNISGPHNGIPNVREVIPNDADRPASSSSATSGIVSKHKAKQALLRRSARHSTHSNVSATPSASTSALLDPEPEPEPEATSASNPIIIHTPPEPFEIPLPASPPESQSRESSPSTQLSSSSVGDANSTAPSSMVTSTSTGIRLRLRSSSSREGRSPKRSLEESDPVPASPAQRKRQRQQSLSQSALSKSQDDAAMELDSTAAEAEEGLSDESALTPLSSESEEASEAPSPPAAAAVASSPPRPLTRRQRKALGLPKARPALVAKVPFSKYHGKENAAALVAGQHKDEKGEWRTNGVGRLDVRGFRELKI